MFARVTKFKMKQSSIASVTAKMADMKVDILALPGLIQFINVMNDDGSGYVISLVESEAQSDANAEAVKALWGQLANDMESMPQAEGFDVQENWIV